MNTQAAVDPNSPLMQDWEAYKATDEYANARHWALNPTHVEGSLWAAFVKGRESAAPTPATPDVEANHVERLLALRNEGGELFIMPEDVEALDVAIHALSAPACPVAAGASDFLFALRRSEATKQTAPAVDWVHADEDAYVIQRLGRLLAEISITLNGPYLANSVWSYHDLPAKVEALASESRTVADEMDAWSEKRLSGPHDNRNVRRLLGGWAERLRAPLPTPEAPSGSHPQQAMMDALPPCGHDISWANEGCDECRDFDAMQVAPRTMTEAPSGSQAGELPERDATKPDTEQGLFRKFDVRRTDGSDAPGDKHHGCDYFVLDVTHDPHARVALTAYADAVEATHPQLATDMRARYALTTPTPADSGARDALVTAVYTVIQNLNNATALMRDKPREHRPDQYWLTAQVNILRAALDAKPEGA